MKTASIEHKTIRYYEQSPAGKKEISREYAVKAIQGDLKCSTFHARQELSNITRDSVHSGKETGITLIRKAIKVK